VGGNGGKRRREEKAGSECKMKGWEAKEGRVGKKVWEGKVGRKGRTGRWEGK
jgi:hypothetical protein